ncbi:MAG: ComF family protein, partial [Bacteroidales bacterium]|nr:ComF family protein [Bacteroidales bacterium]
LCLNCLAEMPLTFFWNRSHNPMADRFNEIIQAASDFEKGRECYACAAALFYYYSEADYRLIPYQIKYHGNIKVGQMFGKMLGARLASSVVFSDVDLVIPVPLHWTRKWKRGYNQAEVIASSVAKAMGVPMNTGILKRRRRTKTQTKLTVDQKARNVSDAFIASCGSLPDHTEIRHVLLIDDVFTTGSTLGACFTALRTVFPPSVRISVATLAFVGRA